MGSEGNVLDALAPAVVHKFGDEDLSDITFIVGGEEFKCHKMLLAARSTYFKAMFFSDFNEKNQDRVTIKADPVAFQRLMEFIYLGRVIKWPELDGCAETECLYCYEMFGQTFFCPHLDKLWADVISLMQLADLFDIRSYTVTALENYMFVTNGCICKTSPFSGTKLLIALVYDMEKYKACSVVTKGGVSNALSHLKNAAVTLTSENLDWLLNLY